LRVEIANRSEFALQDGDIPVQRCLPLLPPGNDTASGTN
jgi:hypothetical protein